MPSLSLFNEELLSRRKKIIGHPLCSSRTRNYLARLTARVMLHSDVEALATLIDEVNRLQKKFDALQPAWDQLPLNTKIALGEIFEDPSTTRETKQYFLTKLTALSKETAENRKAGIEKINLDCADIKKESHVLGRSLNFAMS